MEVEISTEMAKTVKEVIKVAWEAKIKIKELQVRI